MIFLCYFSRAIQKRSRRGLRCHRFSERYRPLSFFNISDVCMQSILPVKPFKVSKPGVPGPRTTPEMHQGVPMASVFLLLYDESPPPTPSILSFDRPFGFAECFFALPSSFGSWAPSTRHKISAFQSGIQNSRIPTSSSLHQHFEEIRVLSQ